MASEENQPPVDQSAGDQTTVADISTSNRTDAKRKNSLEQHLKSRPQRADLVDRMFSPSASLRDPGRCGDDLIA
jgi:hypothetical protein